MGGVRGVLGVHISPGGGEKIEKLISVLGVNLAPDSRDGKLLLIKTTFIKKILC